MRISIVGCGFVGSAVAHGFTHGDNELQLIDPKLDTKVSDVKNFKPELTFVCVPTPTLNDRVDRSIVNTVADELAEINSGITVVKSTMTPDIAFDICYSRRFVYNPEFLTQTNANYDFVHPQFHVFGGEIDKCRWVSNAYINNSVVDPCTTYYMTIMEASLVKYSINSFLATKVTWFNQLKELCDSSGIDYDFVSEAVARDKRIGQSHTSVPGYDGKRGFGGACFPKDTRALLTFAQDKQTDFSLLQEAVEFNSVNYRREA